MHKGVAVRVVLYIEGEDEPAHDFAATGRDLATRIAQTGIQVSAGVYTVIVRDVRVLEGSDDDTAEQ